jgi:hypothetical protein
MAGMTFQKRIEAFLSGQAPGVIPYSIYAWIHAGVADDPAWGAMIDAGLGLTHHVFAYDMKLEGVEVSDVLTEESGHAVRRLTYTTPVGAVTETCVDGWQGEHFLKTPEDYHVMAWIVDHTLVEPRPERLARQIAACSPHEFVWSCLKRSPYQRMLVDLAGVGQFPFHLADFPDDVQVLYEALWRQFRKRVAIVADAPGRFVHFGENFNANAIGPDRYERFILPVYEESMEILHRAGKVTGAHYDGRTANCAGPIARGPLDLLESFTEPPEGDLTFAQARKCWPEKLLWANISLGDYQLPAEELAARVRHLVATGAPDGCRLAFEVSENLPDNWRDSMPVVLQTLNELAG